MGRKCICWMLRFLAVWFERCQFIILDHDNIVFNFPHWKIAILMVSLQSKNKRNSYCTSILLLSQTLYFVHKSRIERIENVGPSLVFCCSSAPRTPLLPCRTDRKVDQILVSDSADRETKGINMILWTSHLLHFTIDQQFVYLYTDYRGGSLPNDPGGSWSMFPISG